jgi:aspartate ammonia-lyase
MQSAELAKEALRRNMSVKELVIEKHILTPEQVEQIFDWEFLIGRKKSDKK